MHYLRNPDAVIVGHGASVLVLADGSARVVEGISGDLLSPILRRLDSPRRADEVEELVTSEVLDDLVELGVLLMESEAELRGRLERLGPPHGQPSFGHVVVAISGAVAAIDTVPVLERLRRSAKRVSAVFTTAAQQFVNSRAFQVLGIDVYTDTDLTDGVRPVHIELARSADVVLVMPASAHTLQRIAHAACSDLTSLTVAAARCPVVVAPTMNSEMWRAPAVQRNAAQLRQDGIFVIEPSFGLEVADGEEALPEICGVGVSMLRVVELLAVIVSVSSDK